ncbi:DnaT-like ssDNA-binding domain-containing protein [Halomonas nitroreducens]|uniref:Helix-turn-helix domain-containing protein n=1 Tax=Halomonas nitroreducens TaxID=447425 RepID=A0A3S0K285_9GAMM|nr:DnaT-like ssDNA-binding domain-containing protein [Halomonas nitroreducens]RTR01964.1 helix-turn-helix domain-containing protein [Halomonas nitroreducens]
MSVEATTWALHQQAVTDPGARAVLFGLANHANHEGRHAFPSVDLLRRYTGLGRRTVIAKLKLLQDKGLIRKGNQRVAAAIIDRADRRPTVYDLALGMGLEELEPIGDEQAPDMPPEPGANSAPRGNDSRGAQAAPRGDSGLQDSANGVQMTTPRGAGAAPEPSGTNPHSLSGAGDAPSEHPVFEQAAGHDDDGQPPAGDHRFAMTLDWQPEPEAFAMACQRAGLPADTEYAPAQLAKFTAHHADAPGRRHGQAAWVAKFVDWIRNDARRAPPAAGSATGGQPHGHRTGPAGQRQRFSNLSAAEARRELERRRRAQDPAAPGGSVYDGELDPGH